MTVNPHARWMRLALEEAEKAAEAGEVPVGAVLVVGDCLIAQAHNEVEARCDSTAHAELLALQLATIRLQNWRLQGKHCADGKEDVRLYVTLEPCTMCIGAMILARLDKLIFGTRDPRQGAAGSVFDLSRHSELPHQVEVIEGVCESECQRVLKQFFENLRKLP